ncbi:MAG TPA: hypothetical protein VMT18_14025 [Planctomycetota bacterium]|nr:hypothetical protein [Planctomycetota bacterium]
MKTLHLSLCLLAALAVACGGDDGTAPLPTSELPERFHRGAAPEGALDVAAARSAAVSGERLAVRGFVGGSEQPFVSGLAAFTLVDPALKSCAGDGMGCETPWDYCCEDPKAMMEGSLVVEFREGGELLATPARGFHGLDHLSEVVVEGLAEVDPRGNVTVVADGVFLP